MGTPGLAPRWLRRSLVGREGRSVVLIEFYWPRRSTSLLFDGAAEGQGHSPEGRFRGLQSAAQCSSAVMAHGSPHSPSHSGQIFTFSRLRRSQIFARDISPGSSGAAELGVSPGKGALGDSGDIREHIRRFVRECVVERPSYLAFDFFERGSEIVILTPRSQSCLISAFAPVSLQNSMKSLNDNSNPMPRLAALAFRFE